MDTGVLVSAYAFGGVPEKAVKKVFKMAEIYVSLPLLNEYRCVPLEIEGEEKINHEQLKTLVSGIAAFVTRAKIVHPVKKITVCRDPEDNMVLECCHAAGAKFLVTGDKDLLEIENLPFDLDIVTPHDFCEKA